MEILNKNTNLTLSLEEYSVEFVEKEYKRANIDHLYVWEGKMLNPVNITSFKRFDELFIDVLFRKAPVEKVSNFLGQIINCAISDIDDYSENPIVYDCYFLGYATIQELFNNYYLRLNFECLARSQEKTVALLSQRTAVVLEGARSAPAILEFENTSLINSGVVGVNDWKVQNVEPGEKFVLDGENSLITDYKRTISRSESKYTSLTEFPNLKVGENIFNKQGDIKATLSYKEIF